MPKLDSLRGSKYMLSEAITDIIEKYKGSLTVKEYIALKIVIELLDEISPYDFGRLINWE